MVTERRVVQPLPADQQRGRLARGHLGVQRLPLRGVSRVDGARQDAGPLRRLDLVAHQREQRGHDHGRPGTAGAQQRGGDEVDRGLAPAGPLHPQRPSPRRPAFPPRSRPYLHWYQPPPSGSPDPICHTRGKHRISPGGARPLLDGRGGTGLAVTDEAIEKIKDMITSGALRAGDRLPREADLAADLGLSRSSLREAVRALSLVNILDVRRGDGTYVTSLEPRLLLEALNFIVDFQRGDTLEEFLRVRRILEPAGADLAAERITDEESDGLRALLDSIGPDPAAEELVASDLEFHRRIVACSGDSGLSSLLESMSGPGHRGRLVPRL